MKKSSQRARALVVGLSAVMVMTGCAATTAAPAAEKKLEFVTYQAGAGADKYTKLITAFEAANAGVKVTLETLPGDGTYNTVLTSRISGGKAPDVFEVLNGMPGEIPYTTAGLLADLSDQPWKSLQIPVVRNADTFVGNKTYQFIGQLDPIGVYYNKDIFSKNNVAVPTNWDEFTQAIATFRAAGVTPLATGAKDGWPLVVQTLAMAAERPEFAAGGKQAPQLLSGKMKFSESAWKSVVKDFSELVATKSYNPSASGVTFDASATDFANGNAAMMIQGTFALPSIQKANPQLSLSSFPLPYVSAGQTPVTSVSYGAHLVIPKKAPHPTLAKKFIAFLATPTELSKFLTDAQAFSPQKGSAGTIDKGLDPLVPAVAKKSAEYNMESGMTPAVQAALQSGLQAIIAGGGGVQDTLAAMDRAQTS